MGYVIYGRAGIPAAVDLRNLSEADGFQIAPFDMFTESFGLVVSAAGDINGDGFEDLAVADAEQGPYSGRTAVIYGKAGGPGDIDLSALASDQGFSIFGVGPYDFSGRSISAAGDVNGDGIDDLLIGAPSADPGGREDAGEAYLDFRQGGRSWRYQPGNAHVRCRPEDLRRRRIRCDRRVGQGGGRHRRRRLCRHHHRRAPV